MRRSCHALKHRLIENQRAIVGRRLRTGLGQLFRRYSPLALQLQPQFMCVRTMKVCREVF